MCNQPNLPEIMRYIIEEKSNTLVVFVDNLMYEFENKKLLTVLSQYINEGKYNIVISLNQIKFINSTGLRFLVFLLSKSRNVGGDTVLIHVPEQVKKLLVMTKLQNIFPIFDSFNEVLTAGIFKAQIATADSE